MQFVEPLIGGAVALGLGFLWYTALFGKAWRAETGISDETIDNNALQTHGLTFVMMVIMCYALNTIIGYHPVEEQTLVHGAFHGMLVGLLFAATSTAINYLYLRKSLKLYLIDASFQVVFLAVAGAVMAVLKL